MLIKLKNKKYIGQCNALSYIFHNRIFKKNIIEELTELRKCFMDLETNKSVTENIETIYEILTRIIYTLMYTYDNNIYGFEEFKKEINTSTISNEVINNVIEVLITNFTDEEVAKELDKKGNNNKKKILFPEHDFLIACLRLNLTIQDLKILSYIDVIKMFILTTQEEKENAPKDYREATQADIDKM